MSALVLVAVAPVPVVFPTSVPVAFPTTVPVHIDDSPWAILACVASLLAAALTALLACFTYNLARQTKVMAEATKALAKETGESIRQTGTAIEAEERRHRQSLQPHLTFVPIKRLDKDGNFDGYTLHVENIGPGYAWKLAVRGEAAQLRNDGNSRLPNGQVDGQNQTSVHTTTRLRDTRPNGLKSGGSWEVGIIEDNHWGFKGLEVTYQDAFREKFRSFVPGIYDTSCVTEFEQLPT
jgi:hypothetical protein